MVVAGLAHHLTQRGNGRQDVFLSDALRRAYMELLAEHAKSNRLRILAYCLMTNHVHIVAIPETEASMANTFRHAHARFSQYWNTERRRSAWAGPSAEWSAIREATYTGRPLGSQQFVAELEQKLCRKLDARPGARPTRGNGPKETQLA